MQSSREQKGKAVESIKQNMWQVSECEREAAVTDTGAGTETIVRVRGQMCEDTATGGKVLEVSSLVNLLQTGSSSLLRSLLRSQTSSFLQLTDEAQTRKSFLSITTNLLVVKRKGLSGSKESDNCLVTSMFLSLIVKKCFKIFQSSNM